jgi:hypothetical protein
MGISTVVVALPSYALHRDLTVEWRCQLAYFSTARRRRRAWWWRRPICEKVGSRVWSSCSVTSLHAFRSCSTHALRLHAARTAVHTTGRDGSSEGDEDDWRKRAGGGGFRGVGSRFPRRRRRNSPEVHRGGGRPGSGGEPYMREAVSVRSG